MGERYRSKRQNLVARLCCGFPGMPITVESEAQPSFQVLGSLWSPFLAGPGLSAGPEIAGRVQEVPRESVFHRMPMPMAGGPF